MAKAIGVDLGGSHTMAAVIDEDGTIHSRHEYDITDRSIDAVVAALRSVIGDALDEAKGDVKGIGIGSPGNIDSASGTIRYSPNFSWSNVPLVDRLKPHFDVPIHLANDAKCATLGEYTFGAGRETKNFALLTLGTGIGAGIVSDGQLLLGHMMGAGEVGHHTIRPDGFYCGCGKVGCFEAQASGTGLIRHAVAIAPSFPRSTLLGVAPGKQLGSKAIRKAAQGGDGHALAAWRRWIGDLAIGVANIIAMVNPEMIAFGGGVSRAGEFMLQALRPLVDELTTMVPRGTTRLVVATLGNDAGAIGAGTVALRGALATFEQP